MVVTVPPASSTMSTPAAQSHGFKRTPKTHRLCLYSMFQFLKGLLYGEQQTMHAESRNLIKFSVSSGMLMRWQH